MGVPQNWCFTMENPNLTWMIWPTPIYGNALYLKSLSGWWFQPLWKILVTWDDYAQYMEEKKTCSKPPTILPWKSHENPMKIPWKSHENPMKIPWKSHKNMGHSIVHGIFHDYPTSGFTESLIPAENGHNTFGPSRPESARRLRHVHGQQPGIQQRSQLRSGRGECWKSCIKVGFEDIIDPYMYNILYIWIEIYTVYVYIYIYIHN